MKPARESARSATAGALRRRARRKTNSATEQLPQVLHCLVQEHRHFAALLNALECKARQSGKLKDADFYLMRDIVGYMHDYPAHVHHPTEALLFDRLLQRKPSLKGAVGRLRGDHAAVTGETRSLLGMLDLLIGSPDPSRVRRVRQACETFISHQREHMRFENSELFPVAATSLSRSDWRFVESRFTGLDDPLFGNLIDKRHRVLYEYMLGSSGGAGDKSPASGWLSMEHMILVLNTLEEGSVAYRKRFSRLLHEVSGETRTALMSALKPAGFGPALTLPWRYAAALGKSVVFGGTDLLRISVTTALAALAPGNGPGLRRAK